MSVRATSMTKSFLVLFFKKEHTFLLCCLHDFLVRGGAWPLHRHTKWGGTHCAASIHMNNMSDLTVANGRYVL
jgi:hypothetical protein